MFLKNTEIYNPLQSQGIYSASYKPFSFPSQEKKTIFVGETEAEEQRYLFCPGFTPPQHHFIIQGI